MDNILVYDILSVVIGIMIGCVLGYMLSTMLVVRRNIQDIHNAVCPSAADDRKTSEANRASVS
jgi:hypothetical protein